MKEHKLIVILLIILFNTSYAGEQPVYSSFFTDEACRVDFYLIGGYDTQSIEIVQVQKIDLWGGSKTIMIDPLNYGNYRVLVYDLRSGKLIYQRGFSTLFEEWQETKRAKDTLKAYEETILFPFPKFAINVLIQSRKRDNSFETLIEYNINPQDDKITSSQNELLYKYVLKNGEPHKKVDIVFLPDGYTEELKSKYLKDVRIHVKKLLRNSPYRKNKKDFNVIAIETWSKNTGTDFPQFLHFEDTRFDCSFNTFGSERYLMTESYWKVMDAACVVPFDQVVILVNSNEYGGGGIYNHYATFTSDHKMSDYVLSHEFGHSFAGLADEYVENIPYEEKIFLDVEPWQPNITTLQNFKEKWANMVEITTPIPTSSDIFGKEILGAYEGAGYLAKGVYRPLFNCSMRAAIRNRFCPVCTQAIREMILLNTY
ncbi:MAG: peptidase [Bacteroidetes bacterium]|nr:peptidase [Bacteroidota bacterium]